MKNLKEYVVQPVDVVLFRKGRRVTEHKINSFFTDPEFAYLHQMHTYARFSHAVYCKKPNGNTTEERTEIAAPEKWTDQWTEVAIPNKWQSIENLPSIPEVRGAIDLKGLRYHGWVNIQDKQAVIAFRGTRFTRWTDWYSNFNFVTRFIPKVRNHYARAKDLIPLFVDAVHSQYGADYNIIATGHSLGGGLAQFAAYSSPHINTVYAFAPSPVTGYRSIDQALRTENKKDNKIARIFEHGEILAYLRFFLKNFITLSIKDPEINEVRFNFSESNAISEHSMGQLSEHIFNQSPHAIHDETYQQIA